MINGPMPLMIIAVSKCLKNHEPKKTNASDNVQGVNECQRERHSVDLGRTIGLSEMLFEQIVHSEALNCDENNRCRPGPNQPSTKLELTLAMDQPTGSLQKHSRQ